MKKEELLKRSADTTDCPYVTRKALGGVGGGGRGRGGGAQVGVFVVMRGGYSRGIGLDVGVVVGVNVGVDVGC